MILVIVLAFSTIPVSNALIHDMEEADKATGPRAGLVLGISRLVEDIVIDDDNNLTIQGTTLTIRRITIKDNAKLIIRNTVLIFTVGSGGDTVISAQDNGQVLIENSTIKGTGTDIGPYGTFWTTRFDGNATIEIRNSNLQKGYILADGGKPRITIWNSSVCDVSDTGFVNGANITIGKSYLKLGAEGGMAGEMGGISVLGVTSISVRDSEIYRFKLNLGSLAYPNSVNMTLTTNPGLFNFWNLYRNGTVSGTPYNITLINSRINKWCIDVYSDSNVMNTVAFDNSNIESLRLFGPSKATLNGSKIGTIGLDEQSHVEISSSMGGTISLPYPDGKVQMQYSTFGISFLIYKPGNWVLSNLYPGFFSHIDFHDAIEEPNTNMSITNSTVTDWSINTIGSYRKSIVLRNCYMTGSSNTYPYGGWMCGNSEVILSNSTYMGDLKLYDNATVVVLSNSTLSPYFDLRDPNASVVRQCLFDLKFLDKPVQEDEVHIYLENSMLLRTRTDSIGEAMAFLVFKAENCTLYKSTYKAIAELRISDFSRGYTSMDFNMTRRQPIQADLRLQHHLSVLSLKGRPSGTGWYDQNSIVTANANYATDLIADKERHILISYTLDGKTINVSRAETGIFSVNVTMDAPHTLTFNLILQYYLTVESEYGSPQGEGWYDAGATAMFSLTSPVGIGIQHVLTGWSGDSTATKPTASVVMDGPKIVTANWRTDYTQIYVMIGFVVVVTLIMTITFKRKKIKGRKQP